MTDSVTSDIRNLYEETVKDSLKPIFFKAFGIHCREPEDGFQRCFKKADNPGNLWWFRKSTDNEIEIDFLAHVTPLSTIPDVDEAQVLQIPNVRVFKSTVQPLAVASVSAHHDYQQKKSQSPEKPDETSTDTYAHFQYVVAEITCGGRSSVLKKLEQLEKDCYFLCSRSRPSSTQASDFKVLETIAFVAVVSPSPNETELQNELFKNRTTYPLLLNLFISGRFVCVEHKETISVVMRELSSKMQSMDISLNLLDSKLSEQSQTLDSKLSEQSQTLESKLSEQSKAFEAKLSEQSKAFEAKLTEQFALFQQFLDVRLPK